MKVFISYATEDLQQFRIPEMVDYLEFQDYIERVFYWDRDCDSNKTIIAFMEETIQICDKVVFICSEDSKRSVPVRNEIEMAIYLNKSLVPIFKNIDDVTLSLKPHRGLEFDEENFQDYLEKLYTILTGIPKSRAASEKKKKTKFREIVDKENGWNGYVIITCSLQNDFIGRDYINEIISDNNDDFKVNYELCEEKWIEYFKDRKISKDELNVDRFITWMKDKVRPTSQKILYSYHKFLEKYNHRVHIDYEQSERLWGNEKLKKFISDLMEKGFKAYKDEESKEFYYFIHLRDYHLFTEEIELEELKLFGPHCLIGTQGAKFIDPLNEYIKQYNQFNVVINSNSLSSFTDTNLNDVLYNIMLDKSISKEKIKIGIFGLFTNVKIQLLTFEFNTMYKFKNVYVCKDYCAGFDAKRHEEGLYYINTILKYTNVLNEKDFRELFNF